MESIANAEKNMNLKEYECGSCYEGGLKKEEMAFMEQCGHSLCKECFGFYLQTKVDAGTEVVQTQCPHQECRLLVSPKLFREFLEPAYVPRYDKFLIKCFVDLSAAAKWCPGNDCDLAYEKITGESVDIVCKCGGKFCIGCDLGPHAPMSCEALIEWKKKVKDVGFGGSSQSPNSNAISEPSKLKKDTDKRSFPADHPPYASQECP